MHNPQLSALFLRFKTKDEILVDRAVGAVLLELTVQIVGEHLEAGRSSFIVVSSLRNGTSYY